MYGALRRSAGGLRLIDGLVIIVVAGLVLFLLLPGAVTRGGWWAVAFCGLGVAGPSAIERLFKRSARQTHALALVLAVIGLLLHALMDGAALATPEGGEYLLPLAVVLHRLPEGLMLWWLLRPTQGAARTTGILVMVGVSTLGGFFFGQQVIQQWSGAALAAFEALVAGTLLHVVFHRHPHPCSGCSHEHEDDEHGDRMEGLGGLFGLAILVGLAVAESLHHAAGVGSRVVQTFLTLSLASAPALVLAYLAAGFLATFMPQATVRWMQRGGPLQQAARGMAVGLPFPVCSCGVVPLYRALFTRGVPATAAMAFLIATPELGIDAVLLSLPLLGGKMTAARVVAAAAVALAVGWFVGRRVPAPAGGSCCAKPLPGEAAGTFREKVRAALRTGLGEMVDRTAPWILLGLMVAAVVEPFLATEWLLSFPAFWQVPFFAIVGMPTYVCAAGATPFVAVLLAYGVSPGAALAFLLTGPATNVTTFGLLTQLHGRRVAATFSVTMVSVAVGIGLLTNRLLPDAAGGITQFHDHTDVPVWRWVSLAILTAIIMASLLRMGVRRFFIDSVLPEPPAPIEPEGAGA